MLKIFDVLILPLGIIVLSIIAGVIVNSLTRRYLHRAVEEDTWKYIIIQATKGMAIPWCLCVGLYWTVDTLSLPPSLAKLLNYILFAVIIMSITHMIAKTVIGIVDFYTMKNMENMPKSSLIDNLVAVFIYSNGILIVLQYFGISIAPILTALGVGGMAVALSLQDTLSNIFAGIHLILSKQIRLNDYIKLSSGEEGIVTDIKWRFTTLMTPENNVVIVPNQTIAKSNLTNFAMPDNVLLIGVAIGVSYDSDLTLVEDACIRVAKEVAERVAGEEVMPALVRFNKFGESAINFNVFLYIREYTNQYKIRHEYIKAITMEFRRLNINIPFPIRTILKGN